MQQDSADRRVIKLTGRALSGQAIGCGPALLACRQQSCPLSCFLCNDNCQRHFLFPDVMSVLLIVLKGISVSLHIKRSTLKAGLLHFSQ